MLDFFVGCVSDLAVTNIGLSIQNGKLTKQTSMGFVTKRYIDRILVKGTIRPRKRKGYCSWVNS
jgi:hypothetical protein